MAGNVVGDEASPAAGSHYRVVYVSRCQIKPGRFGSSEAIGDILSASRRNNPGMGITGALTFNGEFFAQVLEGERDQVLELIRRVRQDARHSELLVVEEGWCSERAFAGWAMAYVDDPAAKEIPVSGKQLAQILAGESGRGRDIVEMLKYLVHEGSLRLDD